GRCRVQTDDADAQRDPPPRVRLIGRPGGEVWAMHDHGVVRRAGIILSVAAMTLALTVAVLPRAEAAGGASVPDAVASNVHCENIAWAKKQGVTKPIVREYHPQQPVARGQMATFLYRVATGGKAVPACRTRPLPDVPPDYVHCGSIQWAR